MDVSELRKRIIHALDAAQKDAAARRTEVDAARQAWGDLHAGVIVPLLRQAQSVLKAERKMFTVHAPADLARLVSDAAPQTFLEFTLEVSGNSAQVIGRRSVAQGGKRVDVEERAVAPGKPVQDLKDEDFAAFIVAEIPKLV
jgi:hypothetical protein